MVRFKGRYYLVSFEFPHDLPLSARAAFAFPTAKEIVHRLKTVIKYHFGQFGLGMVLSNLSAKYYNTATHLFIIKSARIADYIMRKCIPALNDEAIPFQSDTIVSNGVANILRIVPKILHVGGSLRLSSKAGLKIDKRLLIMEKKFSKEAPAVKKEHALISKTTKQKKKKNVGTFSYVITNPSASKFTNKDDQEQEKAANDSSTTLPVNNKKEGAPKKKVSNKASRKSKGIQKTSNNKKNVPVKRIGVAKEVRLSQL